MRHHTIADAAALGALLLTACSGATDDPGESAAPSAPSTSIAPAPTPLAPAPEPVEFALGTVQLDGGTDKGKVPFALTGTVAFPPEAADAPVVLFLHMRGNPCSDGSESLPCPKGKDARYDQGMGWLASALAARGYVVVIPDITPTRDFKYEAVTVPLGYQLGLAAVDRLREAPEDFGIPDAVTVSDTLATMGHSLGGDQAMWAAIDNPGLVSAVVLLEPAPAMAGMFPAPDNPFAFLYGTEQTAQIPRDLPFASVIGRCDDDALYMGGQYVVNATVDPARTAPAALAVIEDGDHVMLNTRATRDTGGGYAGCPSADDADYPPYTERIRAELGQWSADVLDVFLGRQPADGEAARRSGLFAGADAQVEGVSVVTVPAADARTTVLLPLGGAMGEEGQGDRPADDPLAGAADGVAYALDGLDSLVCPAGGLTSTQDPDRAACAIDRVELPGNGPTLHVADTGSGGSWTATLGTPASGVVLATVSVDPNDQAMRVVVSAGGQEAVLEGDALAVPAWDREGPDRTVPRQVRLTPAGPIDAITVRVEGGSAFLQDVVVVPR